MVRKLECKSLVSVLGKQLSGPQHQANCAASLPIPRVNRFLRGSSGCRARRDWAKANADILVKYLQSLIEGNRYAGDPANQAAAVASLSKHLKIDADVAAKSLAVMVGPKGALAKDVRFDMEGFQNALKIRVEIEGGSSDLTPAKYLDLSYYERALLGR